jgi:hypothetical protein
VSLQRRLLRGQAQSQQFLSSVSRARFFCFAQGQGVGEHDGCGLQARAGHPFPARRHAQAHGARRREGWSALPSRSRGGATHNEGLTPHTPTNHVFFFVLFCTQDRCALRGLDPFDVSEQGAQGLPNRIEAFIETPSSPFHCTERLGECRGGGWQDCDEKLEPQCELRLLKPQALTVRVPPGLGCGNRGTTRVRHPAPTQGHLYSLSLGPRW